MITTLALAALFGLMNRVRGGLLKGLGIDTPISGGTWGGIALGAVVWFMSGTWLAGIVAMLAYILGECFGWTKWINCIPGHLTQGQYSSRWLLDDTGKKDGTYFIAQALVDEREDYWWHCAIGMALRGVLWWAPVYAALFYFGLVGASVELVSVIALSVVFPAVYWAAYRIPGFKYLQKAEVLYGLVYGAVLGMGFVT